MRCVRFMPMSIDNRPMHSPVKRITTPTKPVKIRTDATMNRIIAFDMDKTSNHVVNLHSEALIAGLIRCGIRTFEADWDRRFKGLDDLLTCGELCQR